MFVIAHDTIGGRKDDYLKIYKTYSDEVTNSTPGAQLFGSWTVLFGNQDQIINLWRYKNGYTDLDRYCYYKNFITKINFLCFYFSHIQSVQKNFIIKKAEAEYSALCGRRRTVITKPFSYWGEPKERDPTHIYDLRSYVLRVLFFS